MFWYAEKRSVVVNLKTDKAFKGVLWRKGWDYLVLKQAVLLEAGEAKPVDGEVLIFRSEIDFIQVVGNG